MRTLQLGAPASSRPALDSPAALVLLLGTLAGIVTAGFGTWTLLRPIRNPWRQAMLAMIGGLGSFALSLVTIPVDRSLGRPGLLILCVLGIGLAFLLARRRAPSPP